MKTTLNRGATPTGGLEWDLLHDIQIQIDSARHLVNAAFMARRPTLRRTTKQIRCMPFFSPPWIS